MTGCKIGKVTFKDSKLSVIHNDNPDAGLMVEHARMIQEGFHGELTSFIVLGWNAEGAYDLGYDFYQSVIPQTLVPSWVHDVLLRRITVKGTIKELVENEMI